MCHPRIMFFSEFFRDYNGVLTPEIKKLWEESWEIIRRQEIDQSVDWYGDFLECMSASLNLLERNKNNG